MTDKWKSFFWFVICLIAAFVFCVVFAYTEQEKYIAVVGLHIVEYVQAYFGEKRIMEIKNNGFDKMQRMWT